MRLFLISLEGPNTSKKAMSMFHNQFHEMSFDEFSMLGKQTIFFKKYYIKTKKNIS